MTSPELVKPPTWREWKAQNGGRRWYWRAPLAAEWELEWFVYRLRSLALFDLLELAGRATVLVAVIFWFLEADNRAKERHYRAWELINSARGSTGDGGRRDALQDLAKDRVSLAMAPLAQANLAGVDLANADLANADLANADLANADLQGAYLWGANLQVAFLGDVNLQYANLERADLQGAYLTRADLQGANLEDANLQGAYLGRTNLKDAYLMGTDLQGAKDLTQEQLISAFGDYRTKLPAGLTRPAHWREGQPAPQPDGAERAPPAADAPGSDK